MEAKAVPPRTRSTRTSARSPGAESATRMVCPAACASPTPPGRRRSTVTSSSAPARSRSPSGCAPEGVSRFRSLINRPPADFGSVWVLLLPRLVLLLLARPVLRLRGRAEACVRVLEFEFEAAEHSGGDVVDERAERAEDEPDDAVHDGQADH